MLALSIRQPWAWLIIHGGKDIENRSWPTRVRGRVLVHAAKTCALDDYVSAGVLVGALPGVPLLPRAVDLERGGIIGSVEIVDCVTASASPWFCGPYGFALRDARPLSFRPCRGRLGFFEVPDYACLLEWPA